MPSRMGQQKRLGAIPDPKWHLAVLDVYGKARLEKTATKPRVDTSGGIPLEEPATGP